MTKKRPVGGIIHTYQKYDPAKFPSPTQPPPDMVSPAMEHLLTYGNMRRLTEEELRHLRGEQLAIAVLEPDRALTTLPALLADSGDRQRVLDLLKRLRKIRKDP